MPHHPVPHGIAGSAVTVWSTSPLKSRSQERGGLTFGEESCLLDGVSYKRTKYLVLFFCVQMPSSRHLS
jgi:hypothetical protein